MREMLWVSVTPAMAAEWLKLNSLNRPIRRQTVSKYASVMRSGQWVRSPEAIGFDVNGRLIDGQHRLTAVVESGVTVEFLVVRNLPVGVFDVIGQGPRRSSADGYVIKHLEAFGERPKHANYVTSVAARMIIGLDGSKHAHGASEVSSAAFDHAAMISKYLKLMRPNPALSTTVIAAFCSAALFFGDDLLTGLAERIGAQQWTGIHDPMKTLAVRLQRVRASNSPTKLPSDAIYSLTLAAVRAALRGDTLQRVEGTVHDMGSEFDVRLRELLRRSKAV